MTNFVGNYLQVFRGAFDGLSGHCPREEFKARAVAAPN